MQDVLKVARDLRTEDKSRQWRLATDSLAADYYTQAKMYPEAIQAYKRLITETGDDGEASAGAEYRMAIIYRRTGQNAEARACLREILDKYSSTSLVRPARDALEEWFDRPDHSKGGKTR